MSIAALERRAGSLEVKRERRRRVVARVGRAAVDRRVRRGRVDRSKLWLGGRRVDVAGRVDRADLERVRLPSVSAAVVSGVVQVANGGGVDAALNVAPPSSR